MQSRQGGTAVPPTDQEIEAAYGKDVSPKIRAAVKSGVAPMRKPTQFEQERPPEEQTQTGAILGTLGRQIKGVAGSSVAPYTKGYEAYKKSREAGLGIMPSIGVGAARGIMAATPGDPVEQMMGGINATKEIANVAKLVMIRFIRLLLPQVAPLVQVDLPTMESEAAKGHTKGVIAEAAVPMGRSGGRRTGQHEDWEKSTRGNWWRGQKSSRCSSRCDGNATRHWKRC